MRPGTVIRLSKCQLNDGEEIRVNQVHEGREDGGSEDADDGPLELKGAMKMTRTYNKELVER
jgi:hypothetical protein